MKTVRIREEYLVLGLENSSNIKKIKSLHNILVNMDNRPSAAPLRLAFSQVLVLRLDSTRRL